MINLPSALAITKANVKAAATNTLNMLVSGWQFQWLDNLNCQNAFSGIWWTDSFVNHTAIFIWSLSTVIQVDRLYQVIHLCKKCDCKTFIAYVFSVSLFLIPRHTCNIKWCRHLKKLTTLLEKHFITQNYISYLYSHLIHFGKNDN